MLQQGQIFELATRGPDGESLWAYGTEPVVATRRASSGAASTAVVWRMLDANPAKQGVENPQRRRTEKRPFESWQELEALAERLGPHLGPMVLFAAATGMRPGEWVALEHRDIERAGRVAYVR